MPQLTDRERNIIRWALILVPSYLVLFYGMTGFRALEESRRSYRELELEAQEVQLKITQELKKRKRLQHLRHEWQLDLETLESNVVITHARESMRSAASQCGVALGNSSEVNRASNADELRTIHFHATGPTSAILRFLYACPRLGYPVRLDSLQVKGDAKKPGTLTATFSVALLNVDKWKEKRNA